MAITILVVVPIFGQVLLNKSLTRDRATGVVAAVLATGVPGALLWSADLAAAFACGCPIALLSMAAGCVLIFIQTGSTLAVTASALWACLAACFAALAVVSVTAALYWATRWHDLAISSFPVLVSLWVFGYCVDNPVPEISAAGMGFAITAMLLITGISGLAAARATRPFLAGR